MYRQMLATVALATAMVVVATSPAAADWRLLGTRTVMDRTDRDTIVVEGARTFQRVRICVQRNPVQFKDVDIHFRNGGHQDVAMAEFIRPGSCTRAIDLEGGARDIARIDFRYEEAGRGRHRATVRVFGE